MTSPNRPLYCLYLLESETGYGFENADQRDQAAKAFAERGYHVIKADHNTHKPA